MILFVIEIKGHSLKFWEIHFCLLYFLSWTWSCSKLSYDNTEKQGNCYLSPLISMHFIIQFCPSKFNSYFFFIPKLQLYAIENISWQRLYSTVQSLKSFKSISIAYKYMCSSDRRLTSTLRLGSGCMRLKVLATIWNSHLKSKHFALSVQADCPAPRSPSHVGITPAPASVFHVPSLIQRWEPLLRM